MRLGEAKGQGKRLGREDGTKDDDFVVLLTSPSNQPAVNGPYDRALMKRGKAARDLIEQGEDPFQMLLAVVCPDTIASRVCHSFVLHRAPSAQIARRVQNAGTRGLSLLAVVRCSRLWHSRQLPMKPHS